MNSSLRIGVAQYGVDPDDSAASLDRSVDEITALADDGAALIVLPELAVPGYTTDRALLEAAAESIDGATVAAWTALASARNVVVVGGLCERTAGGLYNTAVTVGATGVLAVYRKLHLFGPEKDVFHPGDLGLPVVSTALGVLGACVCYDLRFPEVLRLLALRGAEIVTVPTAWLPGFDTQRWDADGMCPQAVATVVQANLNQVVVACSSAVGSHAGYEFLGSSLIVSASGERLAGPLSGQHDGRAAADVDLDVARAAQHRGGNIDPRLDRRTDVYGVTYAGAAY